MYLFDSLLMKKGGIRRNQGLCFKICLLSPQLAFEVGTFEFYWPLASLINVIFHYYEVLTKIF